MSSISKTSSDTSKCAAGGRASVDVYVKHPSGRTTNLVLAPSALVGRICEAVAQTEGVTSDCVRLKYTGKVLDPELTVGYLGICTETVLRAQVCVAIMVVVVCHVI